MTGAKPPNGHDNAAIDQQVRDLAAEHRPDGGEQVTGRQVSVLRDVLERLELTPVEFQAPAVGGESGRG